VSVRASGRVLRKTTAETAAIPFSLVLLATAVPGTWAFKERLGLIRRCANRTYFDSSEWECLDWGLYWLFWPCHKARPPGAVHFSDRAYPTFQGLSAP